jgi:hypothetical protein
MTLNDPFEEDSFVNDILDMPQSLTSRGAEDLVITLADAFSSIRCKSKACFRRKK